MDTKKKDPLARLPRVVEVEHRSHRVDTDAVDVSGVYLDLLPGSLWDLLVEHGLPFGTDEL